jgi:cytoskeletal protein RodZ
MNLHIERRKRFRKRPPQLVYVELGNGNGGMMRDLSEDGFALRAMMPLAIGEKMHFCLSLEDATRIEGESQVIWTGEGGRAAGLQFVEITPQSRAQIRDWLAALEEPSKEETKQTKPVASASELVERLRREARNVPPRPVAVKQESSVSVAAPEPEQTEQAPPGRPTEYRPESGSVASQILPTAPEVPPPPPVSETPTPPPAHSLATSIQSPAANHAPVWQKPAPALVPLLALEDETEGGELATARAVRRSLFSRTFRIILFLGLGAGIWFYHEEVGYQLIWLGQQMAGVAQTGAPQNKADEISTSATAPSEVSPPPVPSNVTPKTPANSTGEPQMKKPQPSPPTREPAVQEQPSSTKKEEADTPARQIAGESSATPAEAPPDSGQAEYSEAMRILGGHEVGAKLPDAVRLLWVSVKKGNSNAEVTLAGLYRDGRGVQKNCEQTRVLLSAAARKGNASAQKSLQQIVREGCE